MRGWFDAVEPPLLWLLVVVTMSFCTTRRMVVEYADVVGTRGLAVLFVFQGVGAGNEEPRQQSRCVVHQNVA